MLLGIAASTVAAALLHPAGATASRAYYGTDARAAEPLVGVLLAICLVGAAGVRRLPQWGRAVLDLAAIAAVGGLVFMIATMSDNANSLYRGGFLTAALLSAIVVAAATQPGGIIATLLAADPLVALGRISYGVYLFHWPVFLWLTAGKTGLMPPRLLLLPAAMWIVWLWNRKRLQRAREAGELEEGLTFENIPIHTVERLDLS